jgi:hypothetical protein
MPEAETCSSKKVDELLKGIEYDCQGLNANIRFKDDFVRPTILTLLITIGIGSLAFTAIFLYGVVEYIEWRHGATIAYTIVIGTATVLYVALDWAYYTGCIGYPDANQLPPEVYKILRRHHRYWYISPGRYYDDRVPGNIVSVQLMRYTVPALVGVSIVALWVGDAGRHKVSTMTVEGAESTICLVMFVLVQCILMEIIALNRFKILIPWDDIPTTILPGRGL